MREHKLTRKISDEEILETSSKIEDVRIVEKNEKAKDLFGTFWFHFRNLNDENVACIKKVAQEISTEVGLSPTVVEQVIWDIYDYSA